MTMGYGYGPQWGMMGGYGYGHGPLHLIVWVVIIIAVVALMMWLMRSVCMPGMHRHMPRRSAGLDVLEERYARGEINRDEYLQKKKDIGG
jgi:putative membrane protein